MFTGNSCNTAPPAVREWIYTDLYLHSAGVCFLSGQNRTECACPDEKQAYVDATHLNNSNKICRIIYGADKIHHLSFINQL